MAKLKRQKSGNRNGEEGNEEVQNRASKRARQEPMDVRDRREEEDVEVRAEGGNCKHLNNAILCQPLLSGLCLTKPVSVRLQAVDEIIAQDMAEEAPAAGPDRREGMADIARRYCILPDHQVNSNLTAVNTPYLLASYYYFAIP